VVHYNITHKCYFVSLDISVMSSKRYFNCMLFSVYDEINMHKNDVIMSIYIIIFFMNYYFLIVSFLYVYRLFD